MKKVIYMVKKNPAMDNQENWMMLGRKEFMKFVRKPEAKGRFFCDLGGHDEPDDIIYIAECGIEQCKKWRKENNRHRYLKKIESQYEPTISLDFMVDEDGELIDFDEILADEDSNFVEQIIEKETNDSVRQATAKLSDGSRKLIESLFLSDCPVTEAEYARQIGVTHQTIHTRKLRALFQLKRILS